MTPEEIEAAFFKRIQELCPQENPDAGYIGYMSKNIVTLDGNFTIAELTAIIEALKEITP